MPDDAVFCPECGAKIKPKEIVSMAKPRPTGKIVAGVVGVIAVAAAVAAMFLLIREENVAFRYAKMAPSDAESFSIMRGAVLEEGGPFGGVGVVIPDYLDIESDEIRYAVYARGELVEGYSLTIYDGDFDLGRIRTKLEQQLFTPGEYGGVEVWENAGVYYTEFVAFLDGRIVVGDDIGVKKCIDVVKGGEDSLYTNETAKMLVGKLRYDDLVWIDLDPYEDPEGLQANAASGEMLNGGEKWSFQALGLFLSEYDAKEAMDDIENKVREYLVGKRDYKDLKITLDGKIVEVFVDELYFGPEVTLHFYDSATYEPITYTSVKISTDAVTWEYWGYTDEEGKFSGRLYHAGKTVYFEPSGYEHVSEYIPSYGGTYSLYCEKAGVELTAYFYDETTYEPITYRYVEISTDAVTWEYWGYTDSEGKITDTDFAYAGQTVYFRPSGYDYDYTYVSSYGGTEYLYC